VNDDRLFPIPDPIEDGKDNLIGRIARFEEGTDRESQPWLGGPAGLVLGLALVIPVAALALLAVKVAFEVDSPLLSKLLGLVTLLLLAAVVAYWRRQRLAAHFESAQRLITSADAGARQRGFTEMIMNARRGRAEHRRIARALADYLRRPPAPQPDEGGRRQLALSLLCDQTLSMAAKQRLDLSGASLAGLRAIEAELPGVSLRGADLRGVRFARANLLHADFVGASIEGADFTGARLDGTILAALAARR
jgi:hypothetical protein